MDSRSESDTLYQALFTDAADAILIFDDDLRYVDANPAATELVGYTRDEFPRLRMGDLMAAGPERAAAEVERLRRGGEWRGEIDLRRKDGSIVPVEVRARVIASPARTIYISILRDITERLRSQETRQELARLEGVALAGREISHRLNNILAVAIGNLDLVREQPGLPEEARRRVDMAMSSLESASDDIRKFHRAARLRTVPTRPGWAESGRPAPLSDPAAHRADLEDGGAA